MKFSSFKYLNTSQKGIGLVETLAAIGIAIIVITALVSLSVFTLRASNRGKLFLQGSKLANSELELVRACRDSSLTWSDFVNNLISKNCEEGSGLCHMLLSGGTTACDGVSLGTGLAIESGERVVGSGPNEVGISFTVSDPIDLNSGIQTTDSILRFNIRSRWALAGEPKYSYIYSDLSNWSLE